jgi:superfamily I DNA and RNA helicase
MGHTGAVMILGEGGVSSSSRKVKLNTRSSTETELVSADMYMPEMLWSLNFINAQGYEVEHIELHQDSISAQMLEINGRFSSTRKMKHVKAKFFFIKDRIDDGEIKVVDCPTEDMGANIKTKPLQGKGFRVMRSHLMNCAMNYVGPESLTCST